MPRSLRPIRTRSIAAATAVTAACAGIVVSIAGGAVGSTAASVTPHPQAARTVTCTTKNTKVTVTKVARPYNHLLLRATNTGKDNCNAYFAPALGMGTQPQAATWVIEETRPQAVVTLLPGESAYASVIISGIDQREDNSTARTAKVSFQSRKNDGSIGPDATLSLPGRGVINADDAMVTYWQFSRKDALSW